MLRNGVITIVSGLPRCGTSMMMRMLEAGGIEAVVDHIRRADEDNPKGYYEFEKVKKIQQDSSWLSSTHGKAFKMVSMLLFHLPASERYKIIFMQRNMTEMLASQKKMLERKGQNSHASDEQMTQLYDKHLREIQAWLASQKHIEVLYVNYNEVLKNPQPHIQQLHQFLGDPLDESKMMQVVDKALYRQRSHA